MSRLFSGSRRDLVELRKNSASLRKLEVMDWALSIPEDEYPVLVKLIPDLVHVDNFIRQEAWRKFIKSEASRPYRVRDHKSKINYSNSQKKALEPTEQGGGHISGKMGIKDRIQAVCDKFMLPDVR